MGKIRVLMQISIEYPVFREIMCIPVGYYQHMIRGTGGRAVLGVGVNRSPNAATPWGLGTFLQLRVVEVGNIGPMRGGGRDRRAQHSGTEMALPPMRPPTRPPSCCSLRPSRTSSPPFGCSLPPVAPPGGQESLEYP